MPDLTLSLTDYDAWHRENPMSRYSGPAAEKLWDSSIEAGQEDELGNVEGFGWYALFTFADEAEAQQFCCPGMVGAILSQESQGFVSCDTYKETATLNKAWDRLEVAYGEYDSDETHDDL